MIEVEKSGIFAVMLRIHPSLPLLLVVAVCSGCGVFGKTEKETRPSTPYLPLINALDEEYLHSPAGDVAARYPLGWLHVDITTIPMQNVLEVYTDPERARSLVLSELPATAEFRRSVERDGMAALVDQSFAMKSTKLPGKLVITRPTEIYTVNGKIFASYQYGESTVDSLHRKENREILFTTGAKFYELGIIELTFPSGGVSQHVQNFRLLESVAQSLEGAAEVRGAVSDSINPQ